MSAHMRKHHINSMDDVIIMHHAGAIYHFPRKVAEKYSASHELVNASRAFDNLNKKYTKPGALLRGLRAREGYTQAEMAQLIKVTQSDISQMESGVRKIGRKIAQRIETLFDVSYRSFLE